MSIYRIPSSTPTSIFSEAEPDLDSLEKPTHESVSSPAEPLEPQTQRVWEHFHTMPIPEPIPGAQKTLDLFFTHQDTLEGRPTLPTEFRRSKKSLGWSDVLRCPARNCQTFFSEKKKLKSHVLKMHKNETEIFRAFQLLDTTLKCIVPDCTASYERRNSLLEHLRNKHQFSSKSAKEVVIKAEDWK